MSEPPQEFLAIKNWSQFQPKLKNGKDRRDWIRLDTNRVDDPEFLTLSAFARGILTGIMELKGRTGKNPPNDVTYLARAMHTIPTDRPHLRHTIDTLCSHGFLILCNQQIEIESATQDKTGQYKTEHPPNPLRGKAPKKPEPRPENGESTIQTQCKAHAHQDYQTRLGSKPSWMQKDYVQLAGLFKRKQDITLLDWKSRWRRYAESSNQFVCSQGLSLLWFCTNYDRFARPEKNSDEELELCAQGESYDKAAIH